MGRFVWVGQDLNGDAKAYTTDNGGVSWVEATHPGVDNGDFFTNIIRAGDVLLASGYFDSGAITVVESSDDGATFTADTSPLDGVATGNGIAYSSAALAAVIGGFDPVQIIRGTGGPPFTWAEPTFALDTGANRGCYSPSLDRLVFGGIDNLGDCCATSDDGGSTWASAGNPLVSANAQVMDVAWSEELGLFVAVGIDFTDTNLIATSPDGLNGNWTPRGSGGFLSGTSLYSVEWNAEAGIFIAGGNQGEVATSPDGINWTVFSTPLESTTGLAYGDGGWMATGLNSSTGKTAATAPPDGSAWTALTTPADGIAGYVAQGYDVVFIDTTVPDFTGGRFVLVGNNFDFTECTIISDDGGDTWEFRDSPLDISSGDPARAVTGTGRAGEHLVVEGAFIDANSTPVATSPDRGENWAYDPEWADPPFFAANIYGSFAAPARQQVFVFGIGDGNIPFIARGTVDGGVVVTWEFITVPLDPYGGCYDATRDRLVLVGAGPASSQVYTSDDGGDTWDDRGEALDTGGGFGVIAYGAAHSPELDLLVVVGDKTGAGNSMATSDDGGVTWVQQGDPFGAGDGRCVAWSSEQTLFAAGANSAFGDWLVTSPDGANWTPRTVPVTGTVYSIAYGGGRWVAAVDSDGPNDEVVINSVDAASWTLRSSPLDGTTPFSSEGRAVCFLAPRPTPPAPNPLFVRDLIQPARIIITDSGSETLVLLDQRATDGTFLFTLNGPATHTAQVATDDVEINRPFPDPDSPATLTNNRRLCFAFYRDFNTDPPYNVFFGGIVMQVEDNGADASTVRYTAADPWQYMFNRPVRDPYTLELPDSDGLTFPAGSFASDIALQLLMTTQDVEGETHIDFSDLSLIEDTNPLPSEITFSAGMSVGEAWQQLCDTGYVDIVLRPIYDPIARPGKVVEFVAVPRYGSVKFDAVMAWDLPTHSLAGISRLVDGTRLLNKAQYYAGDSTQPAPIQTDAASVLAYGEYWAQQFFPDRTNIAIVTALALAQVEQRRNGARTVQFDPAPEFSPLPFRDYGLGDFMPVWASRNFREPLGVDYDAYLLDPDHPGAAGYQRIYALPVELDTSGILRVRGIVTSSEAPTAGDT